MQKKVFTLLFVLVLVLALAGCGGDETEAPTMAPEPTDVPAATDAPDPTDAPEATEGPTVSNCEAGLEGETINYYYQAGLTGPLSTILGTGFVNALNDAVDELNAAGGVCGATVNLVLTDTQYDPEQEIAVYQQTKANDPNLMVITTAGSGASIALAPLVNEDHVVNIAAGLNAQAFYVPRDGYTVGMAPIYPDQFAGFLQFVSENWDDIKPEGAGDDIIVGVLGWEGPFGAGATSAEALAYAESIGVTVLELETYAISAEADLVTPITNLAVQGANVYYIQSLGFGVAQAVGTLQAMEMWAGAVVGTVNWGMNTDVLTVLGESAGATIDMYGVFPYMWWTDTDVPGVQQALAAFEAGGYPASDMGVSWLTSYLGVFSWAETVEAVINNVGFENRNGEAYFAVMQENGITDIMGVYHLDVRGQNRSPRTASIRQVQLVDGVLQFVMVHDFFELPDMRPPE